MAFSEDLKRRVRERAHYACCLCKQTSMSVEVHHIVPQSENGPDTEDNAAPLCPSCHADFGGNLEKRKRVKEQRDWWYAFCQQKAPTQPEWITVADQLSKTATREDLFTISAQIQSMFGQIIGQDQKPVGTIVNEASSFAMTIGTATSPNQCRFCRSKLFPEPGVFDATICSICGAEQ